MKKTRNNFARRHEYDQVLKFSATLVLFLIRFASSAQDAVSSELYRSLAEFSSRHLPEKCYVQTSRNEYLAGDLLWFAVYAFDGWLNKPLPLSSVVYVELLDDENNPVLQTKLPMTAGDAGGSLDIPDTLASGWYRLRAYTNWMKNNRPEYYFEKPLRIFNSTGVAPSALYPSRLAAHTAPAISGPLSAYRMQPTADSTEMLVITVSVPPGGAGDGKPLWLLAQSHGIPKHVIRRPVRNREITFRLKKDSLGEGIQQFTLFDAEQRPLCETLFFIPPSRRLNIDLRRRDGTVHPRDPVGLSVFTRDDSGKPLSTRFSVSIYRMDSVSTADSASMEAYCWLASELPGTILPARDLLNKASASVTVTDSLMRDNKWSRFSWPDVFSATIPVFPPETKHHIITGRIVSVASGKPAPLIYAYASVVGKEVLFRAAESDSLGIVRFEIPGFTGSNSLVVQTAPEDSAYRVELLNPFSDRFSNNAMAVGKKVTGSVPGLAGRFFDAQIENVYQGDSQQKWVPVPAAGAFFYGKPDYRYHLDDYKRFTTMEEVMREYVKTVNVFRSEGTVKLVMMNDPAKQFLTDGPLVLVDGVPDFDPGRPMNIDPLKIRDIELINHEYLLGPKKYAGIINCISYNGDLAGFTLPSQAVTIAYEGLQPERIFYSPEYATETARRSRVPDYRSQLYWAPSLSTGKDGEKTIHFYTSDLPGRYAVVVNGLSADGMAGSKTIYFNVAGK